MTASTRPLIYPGAGFPFVGVGRIVRGVVPIGVLLIGILVPSLSVPALAPAPPQTILDDPADDVQVHVLKQQGVATPTTDLAKVIDIRKLVVDAEDEQGMYFIITVADIPDQNSPYGNGFARASYELRFHLSNSSLIYRVQANFDVGPT